MASSTSIRPSIGRILHQTSKTCPTTPFALPILAARPGHGCPFSTTPELQERRPKRDNNRLRGLSSLYRSGFNRRTNVDGVEVPKPVDFRAKPKVSKNHGLWEFFYARDKLLLTPKEDGAHGRAWSVEELRRKSWDDLHALWWICVKERNRIATATKERRRLQLRTGHDESANRDQQVKQTMFHIKHALTERFYAWEDARELAAKDPEIDLSNKERPYVPQDYLMDERADAEVLEAGAGAAAPAEFVDGEQQTTDALAAIIDGEQLKKDIELETQSPGSGKPSADRVEQCIEDPKSPETQTTSTKP